MVGGGLTRRRPERHRGVQPWIARVPPLELPGGTAMPCRQRSPDSAACPHEGRLRAIIGSAWRWMILQSPCSARNTMVTRSTCSDRAVRPA